MKKGDIYTKHVRGSRYGFGFGKIFYKYPGGKKIYAIGNWDDLIEDCIDVRGNTSGRIIINEEKEIVTYVRQEDKSYLPFYVGKLKREMRFEEIELNPTNLRPGLFWTGFVSKHGSRYNYTQRGNFYFRETTVDEYGMNTRKWRINGIPEDFLKRLQFFKIDPGSFRVNEYNHVFAPVPKIILQNFYNDDIIHIDDIHKQFREDLTSAQKFTIQKNSEQFINKRTGKKEMWYPIYIGKYNDVFDVNRPNQPHRISNEDDWL